MKSLVGQALQLMGITAVPRRSRTPLLPAWRGVIEAIEDRHRRDRVIHVARYLSARGVEPGQVDDEVMGRYAENVISRSLLTRPKQAVREAILTWNLATRTDAGRHLRQLRVPDNRPHYALALDRFPPAFREDVDAYLASLKGDDLFDERGGKPASPDTIASRRKQILAIASALVEAGRNVNSINDLVELEAAKAALRVVWNRLERRKTSYLQKPLAADHQHRAPLG